MTTSKISAIQASTLRAVRTMDATFASEIRKAIFASIKSQHGIPADDRIKVEVDDVGNPNYLVIIRKKTGNIYINGVEETAPAPTAWFPLSMGAAIDEIIDNRYFSEGVQINEAVIDPQDVDGVPTVILNGQVFVKLSPSSDFE
jgi:hypothetical protein